MTFTPAELRLLAIADAIEDRRSLRPPGRPRIISGDWRADQKRERKRLRYHDAKARRAGIGRPRKPKGSREDALRRARQRRYHYRCKIEKQQASQTTEQSQ